MGNPPGWSPRWRILKNPGKYVDALVEVLEDAGSIPAASKIYYNFLVSSKLRAG